MGTLIDDVVEKDIRAGKIKQLDLDTATAEQVMCLSSELRPVTLYIGELRKLQEQILDGWDYYLLNLVSVMHNEGRTARFFAELAEMTSRLEQDFEVWIEHISYATMFGIKMPPYVILGLKRRQKDEQAATIAAPDTEELS